MIELRNLSKSFRTADGPVDALRQVNLTINNGDIYGIIGMSGAGKSTLVRCINMLERPTEGDVLIDGVNVALLNNRDLRAMRRRVTMIFQGFNLLMQRTCLKNIMLPLRLSGVPKAEAEKRALQLLETVGLPDKANAYPAQLSGGQQQRIAIARALATKPDVLLCDEATSALDPKTTHAILALLREINREMGITIIVITHQMSVVQEVCNRVAILQNGAVAQEGEVSAIFSQPKAQVTRNLIYPEMADGMEPEMTHGDRHLVRIIFNGSDSARKPLIATMVTEIGVAPSILSASTRSVGDKAYGYMLLEFGGTPDDLAKVMNYLYAIPDISVSVESKCDNQKKKET